MNIDQEQREKANSSLIENEIENLDSGHWKNMFRRDYKEFWEHSRKISEMFKTLKPISKENRERLWEKFRSICDQAKYQQNDEQLKFNVQSNNKRESIEIKIKEAYYYAKGGKNQDDLSSAKNLLNEAMDQMKDGEKMTKEDNNTCYEKWREANQQIRYKREWLWELNYDRLKGMAYDAQSTAQVTPHEGIKKIKETQSELKSAHLSKDQRGWIRDILDEAYEIVSRKFDEIRQEKERKHQEWSQRMEEKVSRWQGSIEKCEDAISRLESQISDLEYKESSARSDDFASTVRGWISEKYDKIGDIRQSIRDLDDKIESVNSKLRD